MVLGMIMFNLVLSVWNALAVGRAWQQSKDYGGLPRLTALCGATLSTISFLLGYIALAIMLLALSHTYSVIILPPFIDSLSRYLLVANGIMSLGGLLLVLWADHYQPGKHSRFMFESNEKWLWQPILVFPIQDFDLRSGCLGLIFGLIFGLVMSILIAASVGTTRLIMNLAGAIDPQPEPRPSRVSSAAARAAMKSSRRRAGRTPAEHSSSSTPNDG